MGHSTAAAIWIERTGLPIDELFAMIEQHDPRTVDENLLLQVFERSQPAATLVIAALDGLDIFDQDVFVDAPASLSKQLGVRVWRISGFAGSSDYTRITEYAATGEETWDVGGESDEGERRLLASTGAASVGLTLHIRPYLEPDASWVPRVTRRAGVPQVPWKPSVRSVPEIQSALGAAIPLAPGPSYLRTREFGQVPETQVVVRLADRVDPDDALELLGTEWMELDPMPAYALEVEEMLTLLGNRARPLQTRITARTADCVMSVVLQVPRGPTWLVLTTIHAPPPQNLLAGIAELRAEE